MEYKVIQSGSVVEVYKYHQIVSLPRSPFKKVKYYNKYAKHPPVDNRACSASRSRRNFMRLVNSNTARGKNADCFLTLTFRPKKLCNLVEANYEWKKFHQKLKRLVPDLSYCLAYEWGSKNGRFHYHIILFDFPFIEADVLETLWGNGFIKIKKIDPKTLANVGAYVAKYMAKDMAGGHYIDNKRRYFASRNLLRPRVFRYLLKSGCAFIARYFNSLKHVVSFVFTSTMRFISSFDYAMYAIPPTINKIGVSIALDLNADLVG